MAVTYRLPQAGGALQNPAYRLADALQMRGSAQHAGPLANFMAGFIEFLEFGDNARDNNPFRPERLPFDPKRALNRLAVWISREHIEVQVSGSTSQNGGLELPGVRSNYLRR